MPSESRVHEHLLCHVIVTSVISNNVFICERTSTTIWIAVLLCHFKPLNTSSLGSPHSSCLKTIHVTCVQIFQLEVLRQTAPSLASHKSQAIKESFWLLSDARASIALAWVEGCMIVVWVKHGLNLWQGSMFRRAVVCRYIKFI